MKRFLLGLVLTLFAVFPASAQQDDIRNTISGQINAFLVDDFDTAFTFAAPHIQGMFRNPAHFETMVRNGYPMVHRPANVEFQKLRDLSGQLIQEVLIRDQLGAYYLAAYVMVQTDMGWKISGVSVLRAPGTGV